MGTQTERIVIDVGADITKARAAMGELKKIFNSTDLGADQSRKITAMFSELGRNLDQLERKSSTALTSLGEAQAVKKVKDNVQDLIVGIADEFQKIKGLGDNELVKNFVGMADGIKSSTKAFKAYDEALNKINADEKKAEVQANKTAKAYQDASKSQREISKFRKDLNEPSLTGKGNSAVSKFLEDQVNTLKIANDDAQKRLQDFLSKNNLDPNDVLNQSGTANKNWVKKNGQLGTDLQDVAQQAVEAGNKFSEAQKKYSDFQDLLSKRVGGKELADLKKQADDAKQAFDNLVGNRSQLSESAFNDLKKSLSGIFGADLFKNITNSSNAVQQFQDIIKNFQTNKIQELKKQFPEIEKYLNDLGDSAKTMGDEVNEGVEKFSRLKEASTEVEHLSSRLKYFFSLAGGFNLMRRAIRDAVNTTKELDAVMTQTAVVSQNTVADMWKTLPQYSKEAKKLGAEIKDVYSAQTLYVQQGLDMNSAMDLGVETLKMARVANIDAAEATNSMTAALRGFNMELNEASAQRVNDVYSKLAQNTASDVKEISTAMSKVAALANSANMSFENTSAFLATIIESTREGAETAGTALKTVIARFSEVKKLYSEGDLIGSDEEGQEIDVNKIGTALRTAGINMNEFFLGTKGLDEIFKELGSKWSSLTTVQQRYIATQAAGSRQQSRFLALMQNYSRTLELTEMAYNSTGSSQEQFEKTLDSLASKINILKDEWNTFIMGIANSDLIKGFIDTGTTILTTINNIIDAISGGNGLVKSITSIATAVGVFKGGGAILKGGLGKISDIFKGAGKDAQKGFFKGLTAATSGAVVGQRGQAGTAFVGNYLRNAFLPWQTKTTEKWTGEQWKNVQSFRQGVIKPYSESTVYNNMPGGEKLRTDAIQLQKQAPGGYYEQQAKLGLSKEQADKALQDNSRVYKETTSDIQALGNAALLAGGLLVGLGAALESTGAVSKKTATWIKGAGAALLAFGAVLKITGAAVKAFSGEATVAITSIPIIGWIAAVIAGLLALGTVLHSTFSISARANAAQKLAEEAKSAADQAKQSFEDLEKAVEDIESQQDIFDDLIVGTQEWDTAVQNLNNSILELLQLYPEIASAIEYVDGHLSLNTQSEAYKEWLEIQKKNLGIATGFSESATYNSTKLNSEKEVVGDEVVNFFEGIVGYTNAQIDIYKNGLEKSLNDANIDENITKQLIEGIHKGSITNSATLEAFLKNIDKESANAIRNIFKVTENQLQPAKDIFGNTTLTPSGLPVFSQQTIVEDYTDEFIKAEYQRSRTQNKNNFIGAATSEIENVGLNTSEYANMWLEFAKQRMSELLQSENLDVSNVNITIDQVKNATGLEEITPEQYENYVRYEAARQQIFDKNNELYQFLSGLEGNDLAWANAAITGNKNNLTLEQLQTGFGDLFNTAAEVFGDKFTDYFQINENNANQIYKNLFKDYENYREPIESVSETTGQVENYKRAIDTFRAQGVSDEEIGQIFKLIKEETENLGEEETEQVKSLFSTIDFSSRDSIRKIVNQLDEFGIATDGLADRLINLSNATKTISETKLSERLEGLEDTKSAFEKITSGEGKTITQKQYENAVAAGYDFKADEWIKTGTKEWTYIGSETNSLLTSIDAVVAQIAGDLKSDTEDAVNRGTAIANVINRGQTFYSSKDGENGWFTLPEVIENWQNAIEKNSDWGNELAGADFAGIVGLAENATRQNVVDAFNEYYGPNGNAYEANKKTYEQLIDKYGTQFAAAMSSGQAILNATKVNAEGIDNEAEQRFLEEDDASKALRLGLTEEDESYLDYLKEVTKVTDDYDDILRALIGDSKTVAKNFDNLNSVYKDNKDNLDNAKKGTAQYRDALVKLTAAARQVFGKDITKEFVEKHLEDFKKMEQGDKEALNNIRKDLAKSISSPFEAASAEGKALDQIIAGLDGHDFEINGFFDASQILQGLSLTKENAEKLAEYLNSIGWSASIQEFTGADGLPAWRLVVNDTLGNATSARKGAGGGGGGGGGKEFKNDFDKYYNMVEDSNELERLRNLLETDYNQLLKEETKSAKQIYDNLKQQIKLLRERATIEADLAEKRRQQIIDTMSEKEYQGLQKYAWWNDQDRTVEINWDLINTVKDSEQGSLIKEYVSRMEDFQSKYDEAIETLEDIESTIQEIEKRGREEYTSLEDRVRDALLKQIQDRIDELTAVDEAINDTNQKLFDSISETLELQRQNRDNAKTEEELTDKEKRLAYLQQDSSNANALEIAKLQEELADARQDYTDTLIDQRISELQRQNDEAQEQRQQQIELMQQSLEWEEKAGMFWDEAYRLISEGTDMTGSLVKASELEQLLKNGEAWDSLSEEGKMKWLEELEDIVAQGLAYLELSRQLEDIGTQAGSNITFTTADGKTLTGTVDKNGNVVVKDANGGSTTYKDVYQDYHGAYKTYETAKEAAGANKPTTNTSGTATASGTGSGSGDAPQSWQLQKTGEIVTKIWGRPSKANNVDSFDTYAKARDAANKINQGIKTKKSAEIVALQTKYNILGSKADNGLLTGTGLQEAKETQDRIKELQEELKNIPTFKTGGVADFTGPAWLDGTKSRPELVLNARDTENFIQLKDTLADMRRSSESLGSKGDVYFDIDVQVDQMSSDYDVDQAIDRFKARIVQDGAYRSVNTLSRLR